MIICGLAGGFINTVAASGATVVVPSMIGLGLEAGVANGTSRLAAVAGLATATWRFHPAGAIPWLLTLKATVPMVIGATAGSLWATSLSDQSVSYTHLRAHGTREDLVSPLRLEKKQRGGPGTDDAETKLGPSFYLLMAATGFWAGFIALGSGVMTLLVLVLAGGIPLKTANILKCFVRLSSSLVALLIFGLRGDINWLWALPLALSGMAGAHLGARLALGDGATQLIFRALITVVGLEVLSFLWRLGLPQNLMGALA